MTHTAGRYPLQRAFARAMVAAVFGAGVQAAQAEPRVYQLDPDHTFVTFEVLHFGTSTLRGRFGPVRGAVQLDPPAGRGYVGLRIGTAAVDTGVKFLDKRLCEPDLLDCVGSPEAFFVAERFVFEGSTPRELRGELTLHGTSQPLTLRAVRYGCYRNPILQREVCGGDYEADLLRSEFGASFGAAFVSDRVRLKIQVEGIAP
jgi:polyisoprenoid-binding protein YceI